MNRSAVREIQGIGRFRFREGELEDFKRLSATTSGLSWLVAASVSHAVTVSIER
jgi:hypothetical protein